ncbi:MAG: DUF4834 family protein [Bacteroidetes bacterium]|nr:DUF4834 family protein [Bacteroidota bacterium]
MFDPKDEGAKKEGEVTIHNNKQGNRKIFSKDSGEYVDYEEVDEEE